MKHVNTTVIIQDTASAQADEFKYIRSAFVIVGGIFVSKETFAGIKLKQLYLDYLSIEIFC